MQSDRVCPLDGSRDLDRHPDGDSMVVCRKCSETLNTNELVVQASSATARHYVRANHLDQHPDYQAYMR